MLRKVICSLLLGVLIIVMFSSVVFAAWEYIFPTTVTDSSNTTRTYYPVFLGYGGQALVDNGKISANGTFTNMQVGGSDIKYMMSTTNVTAVLPLLPAGGIATANLYTGYTPEQSGFPIIPGEGGYVTVSDNASMEPAANFSMSVWGYMETSFGSNKNIIYKQDAFKTYVSAISTVTATILNAFAPVNADELPDGINYVIQVFWIARSGRKNNAVRFQAQDFVGGHGAGDNRYPAAVAAHHAQDGVF